MPGINEPQSEYTESRRRMGNLHSGKEYVEATIAWQKRNDEAISTKRCGVVVSSISDSTT
eukprot:198839-Prorocentrum_minimum.AAC.3